MSDENTASALAEQALKAARQFIRNGVEYGYIRMPDADTPDSAHDTLPLIERALASLAAASAASLVAEPVAGLVPEINYDAAIGQSLRTLNAAQGTRSCIAFVKGAEWFRECCLAAAPLPASPAQPVVAAIQKLDMEAERMRFATIADAHGWTPGDFVLGAYAGWLAAKQDAAPKVEAPAARAEGEAPAKPTWGYAKTVGNAIAQLQTMDATLPFYAALHLQDGRCIARGVTFSRERVVNERWIDNANKDVPYSIVVWSQPVESLYAATPKAEPPASGLRAETDAGGEVS